MNMNMLCYAMLCNKRDRHVFFYCLPLQRLLLLGILDQLLPLDGQPLAAADGIHVPLGDVLAVGQLAQVLELLLRGGDPEGVLVERLEAREDELRRGGARRALADLLGEAERFGHGEQREDGEEGRAFLHHFGEDAAAAPRDDAVDAAQDFGCNVISLCE
ncbi:hypothetical protein VTN02DRAFT_768 [Thermoascus thermophilus]